MEKKTEKFKGLFVPIFSFGTVGEMKVRCENARLMQSCESKCQECLFNYEDRKKQSIFRAWMRKKEHDSTN